METQSPPPPSQDQIVDELRQLCSQYLAEVPSRRRVWTRSIKSRVFELLRLDLSCEQIAAVTEIPVPTIYGWKRDATKSTAFLPVKIVQTKTLPEKARAPEVPIARPSRTQRKRYKKATPTIIVIAPNGLRFEGLNAKTAVVIARALGALQAAPVLSAP